MIQRGKRAKNSVRKRRTPTTPEQRRWFRKGSRLAFDLVRPVLQDYGNFMEADGAACTCTPGDRCPRCRLERVSGMIELDIRPKPKWKTQ